MARDINKRLNQLRTRRGGIDQLNRLNDAARVDLMAKLRIDESWQKRAGNKPYTRYALGAMQEVDPEYTRISLETAERVGKQLDSGLAAEGISVEFRLQGSVPLNVHIRGVSDVDLLNLDLSFRTYHREGVRSRGGHYIPAPGRSSLEVLKSLRAASERVLKAKFPAANVDTSGGKAIAISGGSLARPVDVVPSHWYDTIEHQASGAEHDRAVTILNKKVPETIDNWPFLHIFRIHQRDVTASGGLKKAIRLCKNVKNDAIEDGTRIVFPSFDIAATMYHANMAALRNGAIYELAVLAETQRFLDELYHDASKAKSLRVPDGSRLIFDTQEKYEGLKSLSMEMDDLAREVAKEQDARLSGESSLPLGVARDAIANSYVL